MGYHGTAGCRLHNNSQGKAIQFIFSSIELDERNNNSKLSDFILAKQLDSLERVCGVVSVDTQNPQTLKALLVPIQTKLLCQDCPQTKTRDKSEALTVVVACELKQKDPQWSL